MGYINLDEWYLLLILMAYGNIDSYHIKLLNKI